MKFKARVKALPEAPEKEPRPRRSLIIWVGTVVWVVTVFVCLRVSYNWPRLEALIGAPGAEPTALDEPQAPVAGPRATRPEPVGEPAAVARKGHRPKSVDVWENAVQVAIREAEAAAEAKDAEPAGGAVMASEEPRAAASADADAGGAGRPTTCEGALAAHREQVMEGAAEGSPRITRGRNQAVLDNGSYFQHCAVPEQMEIRICAAVQRGRAKGVTVHTDPDNHRVSKCIADAARELEFPSEAEMDVTHSEFHAL